MSGEQLTFLGEIAAHNGWVTAIDTFPLDSNQLLTASRDKTIKLWDLTREGQIEGTCRRALRGHSHTVEDVTLSSDGKFCMSASWDGTLALWDLATGERTKNKTGEKKGRPQPFTGHKKDVLSVAFSADNRQIVSGSRDKTIKLWNTLGECKYTIVDEAHDDWVSCVRFSPTDQFKVIVSAGWDKLVKVWSLSNLKLRTNLVGHTGYLNTVTVSPDGSLCASGGKDGTAMLWDLNEGKRLYSLPAGDIIHALIFSPNRYWLCAATEKTIKIWDLESKVVVDELSPELAPLGKKALMPHCCSLKWSADGSTLFAGYTDGQVRVWLV